MPTVLLLDVSISLARPVHGSDKTRKDLVQRGALHFLQFLETNHPLEQICVITFSSDGKVVAPFTRDHAQLRASIQELKLQDKTALDVGLLSVLSYATHALGSLPSALQIVLITDGRPNGKGDPMSVVFPFPIKLHVIAFGHTNELNINQLKTLSSSHNGSFRFVELPSPHSGGGGGSVARAFKKSVEELCHSQYAPYIGTLAFGHLSGVVKLHPDPNTTLHISSLKQGALSSLSSMPSLGNLPSSLPTSSNKNHRLPSTLTIMGFVSTKNFPSPPSISRHALVPQASTSNGSTTDSTKEDANLSDDALLCSLLYQTLKNEKTAAIIQLDDSGDWFGLLYSISDKDNNGLFLSILPPTFKLPWIGDVSALLNPSFIDRSEMSAHRSYSQTKPSQAIPSIREEVLAIDCQKIIRFATNLPQKADYLYAECSRLRHTALVYSMPSLVDGVVDLLSDIQSDMAEGSDAYNILQDLIQELTRSGTRITEKPKDKVTPENRSSRAMSVNSLLN